MWGGRGRETVHVLYMDVTLTTTKNDVREHHMIRKIEP